MFTGIVEARGRIDAVEELGGDRRMTIVSCDDYLAGLQSGDSVAVSGVCLTAVRLLPRGFTADLSLETLKATTAGGWQAGSEVNLERALTPANRESAAGALFPLGGVTWAFDCVGHPAVLRSALDCLDWGGTAVAIGIHATRLKLVLFCASAAIAGLAGAAHGLFAASLYPDVVFSVDISLVALAVPLIGGVATATGPVIGAALYVGIREVLQVVAPGLHLTIVGLLLLAVVLFLREGVGPALSRVFRRGAGAPRVAAAVEAGD